MAQFRGEWGLGDAYVRGCAVYQAAVVASPSSSDTRGEYPTAASAREVSGHRRATDPSGAGWLAVASGRRYSGSSTEAGSRPTARQSASNISRTNL